MPENIQYHLIPYPKSVKSLSLELSYIVHPIKELSLNMESEAYLLRITPDRILMKGGPKGLIWAEQTLAQLRLQFTNGLPCLEIQDAPRFLYRGFMLDSSRHFLPKEDILRLLQGAAFFKLNTFHWHLADDQGWRLELKGFPKLTTLGARRGPVHFGRLLEPDQSQDFFTTADVKEIIAYAANLGIEVMPEIEIPGHASALLAAYPQMGCNGANTQVKTHAGIFDSLICAGKEESWQQLKNLLNETAALFPSKYIHIGGDEAVKRQWRQCPHCQKRIKDEDLKDENGLQQWLMRRVQKHLHSLGKEAILWNDSLRGLPLPNDFVVQAWLGDRQLLTEFANRGGKVIQSSTKAYYFDYPYFVTDVDTIFSHDPCHIVPEAQLLGLECTLWTERVNSLARAAYLLFPRLPAMAETAWTALPQRRDNTFDQRYETVSYGLEALGLYSAPREYWHPTAQGRAREERMHAWLSDTAQYRAIVEAENKMLQAERAIYGDETLE